MLITPNVNKNEVIGGWGDRLAGQNLLHSGLRLTALTCYLNLNVSKAEQVTMDKLKLGGKYLD